MGPSAGGRTRHHVDHGSAQQRSTAAGHPRRGMSQSLPPRGRWKQTREPRPRAACRTTTGPAGPVPTNPPDQCAGSPFGVGSNRRVTDPSVNTSLIAVASRGAIDSTVSLSIWRGDRQRVSDDDLGDGRVGQALRGGIGQDPVGGRHDHIPGALLEQGLGCLHDRPPGVDHVVDDHAGAALDVTDHLEHPHLVGHVRITALVDDRQRRAQDVGPALGDTHPTGVRGDDGDRLALELVLDVVGQQRQREQVVDRAVEEALDLCRCAGPPRSTGRPRRS